MVITAIAASLFFTNPAPLDMPRAEAYFVRENGRRRLEDVVGTSMYCVKGESEKTLHGSESGH